MYNKLFNNKNNRLTSSQIDDSILLLYKYNYDTNEEIDVNLLLLIHIKQGTEKIYNSQYKLF